MNIYSSQMQAFKRNRYPSTDEMRLHLNGIDVAQDYLNTLPERRLHAKETRQIIALFVIVAIVIIAQIVRV